MTARPDDGPTRYDETERVAGVGSFDYRPQDGVATWSDNLYRIYGLDPARDHPLDIDEFRARVHPDDHGALDAMMATMAGGGIYTADLRFRRPDGVERALHLRGESVLNADGLLERAHGTTQDVTETRAIVAELRESRRRVVEAMRVAGVGSFEGRPDTGEFVWSEELYALFGLDPSDPQWTVAEYMERMASGHPAAPRATSRWGPSSSSTTWCGPMGRCATTRSRARCTSPTACGGCAAPCAT